MSQVQVASRKRPGVSAVVVSYFTGPLLARALASLQNQPEIIEIFLIDNGNWPGAVDDAVSVAAGAAPITAPITVVTGHGNIGFSAGCNLGAERAAGDYLLFMNPDAVMPSGGVAALMDAGEDLERPFILGPKLVGPNGLEQQGSRRATLTPWRAFVEITGLYKVAPRHPYFRRFNLHADPCPGRVCPVPTLSGACFFLPKDDYALIGGMDERYFLHVEDVDFCLRFANAGGTAYFAPDVSVTHFKSSSRVNPLNVERRKTTSMLRYFRTHFSREYPAPFLWLVSLAVWAAFAAKAAERSIMATLRLLGLSGRDGDARRRRVREFAARRSAR
ncbi:MAG: glycosyltransferase family 2 protein [Pseudomonadota bacterium]